ncbi:Dymeclin [Halotydeus destructor]|nr:Dymeclin [Halotydeus destructor]
MGTTNSTLQSLKQNPNFVKLASKSHVSFDDSRYWNELLDFTFGNAIKSSETVKAVEDAVELLLNQFLQNNSSSGNLASLVKVYADRASQLRSIPVEDARFNLALLQTSNSLFVLRCCLKRIVQSLTEENVITQFAGNSVEEKDSKEAGIVVVEHLANALIETIVDVPFSAQTYALQVETITVLLILLSVQMYSARPAQNSAIYKVVMQKKCAIHALLLTKCLMVNFINQAPAPYDDNGSLIIGLASGLWNVLTLGYGRAEEDPAERAVMARMSLLLLLVLTNHCTTETNPYRDAIASCCDSQAVSPPGEQKNAGFKVDFSKLFTVLSESQHEDQSTLLLYLLLHKNESFRAFALSKTSELDKLVIPVLRILYDCPERSSHHVYMALIILLILTEDSLFNEAVHDTHLKNVTWYQDRNLSEISLGGLIVLVVIRAIQYNISRTRDKFLHTNLLATLANMSNHFKNLNPYVCQKLMTLFKKLSRKFNNTLNQVNQNHNGVGGDQSDARSDVDTDIISIASPDLANDLSIFEEVLRMILEIINSCLSSKLTRNADLVYTLLYNREIFEQFQSHPSFQDIVLNIETVLIYFSNRIERESEDTSLSVNEVYQIIQQSSLQWPSEKIKKFPELKFRYVEDDSPEEFFIPYVWSLVYRSSTVYFNAQNILLFNPHRNVI